MFSRPVLIGRGLGSLALAMRFRVPTRGPHPHRVSVAIAEGRHPVPFRTRKLSPPAPMVLPWRRGGRVGRRRDISPTRPLRGLRCVSGYCRSGYAAIRGPRTKRKTPAQVQQALPRWRTGPASPTSPASDRTTELELPRERDQASGQPADQATGRPARQASSGPAPPIRIRAANPAERPQRPPSRGG